MRLTPKNTLQRFFSTPLFMESIILAPFFRDFKLLKFIELSFLLCFIVILRALLLNYLAETSRLSACATLARMLSSITYKLVFFYFIGT